MLAPDRDTEGAGTTKGWHLRVPARQRAGDGGDGRAWGRGTWERAGDRGYGGARGQGMRRRAGHSGDGRAQGQSTRQRAVDGGDGRAWRQGTRAMAGHGDRGHGRGLGTVATAGHGDRGRGRGLGTAEMAKDPGHWYSTGARGGVPACPPSALAEPPVLGPATQGGGGGSPHSADKLAGGQKLPEVGTTAATRASHWCQRGMGSTRPPAVPQFPRPAPLSLETPGGGGGTRYSPA